MAEKQLDKAFLHDLKTIMGDDFDNLLNVFMSDSENRLSQLSLALDSNNFEEIRKLAHGLKGSSANMAAENLQVACQKMEEAGTTLDLQKAKETLPIIESVYREVKQELLEIKEG